ncbi:MAG TPA: hypothetical protein DCZ01_07505 [Elusimicrobia bacterium]|nr:MAG: hypothetical protein A2X37_06465 [Elusimicrobia bacterium GWA2_66_18]OGR72340.1 MAG: hypothetical protein A2X40_07055 [Elusimicrobia bacterium GWC2_65_9]HAZ08351.1 hypothetical protein [Elusimicrobiota bacterium]
MPRSLRHAVCVILPLLAAGPAAATSVEADLLTPGAVDALDFDGGLRRPPGVEVPTSPGQTESARPASAVTEEPRLLRALLSRVTLYRNSDPRAAAALQEALRDILRTRTGRQAAEDFVDEGASCDIRFDKLDGSLITVNGVRVVSGVLGETRSNGRSLDGRSVVALNSLFLDADPPFAAQNMAETIAHEMFGHALEHQRAARDNFPAWMLNLYRGDEANARLIGWLVLSELGAPLSDGDMWSYLQDPERFHDRSALIDPYYAQSLSPAEMGDPLPVLRSRLEETRRRRERLDDEAVKMRKWRIIIEHLTAGHGMERRRFASISEDIENFLERELPRLMTYSHKVEDSLQNRIDFLDTEPGLEQLWQLSQSSRSEYLRSCEERISRYRARLGMQTQGRKPETRTPPPPDQIDEDGLETLYQDDLRDNPRHWGR